MPAEQDDAYRAPDELFQFGEEVERLEEEFARASSEEEEDLAVADGFRLLRRLRTARRRHGRYVEALTKLYDRAEATLVWEEDD